jgi:hypothetical protein
VHVHVRVRVRSSSAFFDSVCVRLCVCVFPTRVWFIHHLHSSTACVCACVPTRLWLVHHLHSSTAVCVHVRVRVSLHVCVRSASALIHILSDRFISQTPRDCVCVCVCVCVSTSVLLSTLTLRRAWLCVCVCVLHTHTHAYTHRRQTAAVPCLRQTTTTR